MSVEKVYVCVKDMDRAIWFYNKLFGFPPFIKDEVYTVYDMEGVRYALFDYTRIEEGDQLSIEESKRLETYSNKKMLHTLLEMGARITSPPMVINNNWVFEFEDSEGNEIEVVSPYWS